MEKTGIGPLWRFDCLLAPSDVQIVSSSRAFRKRPHFPITRCELEGPCPRSRYLLLSQKWGEESIGRRYRPTPSPIPDTRIRSKSRPVRMNPLFIKGKTSTQPICMRRSTCHHKHMADVMHRFFARPRLSQVTSSRCESPANPTISVWRCSSVTGFSTSR